MAETIESFVTKLQTEGIQAGQAAAEKIQADAEREARRLIEAAETQARNIVEDAKAESRKTRSRTETELKLAARDTVLRLHETLSRVLKEVLLAGTRETLGDVEFLKHVLHDVILQYVQADIEGKGSLVLNVSEQTRQKLAHWAIEELHKKAAAPKRQIDLQAALAGVGFEYQAGDGTVEVTPDSVVEVLAGLVGPELRRMIARATDNGSR